jgi:hypothetical protein
MNDEDIYKYYDIYNKKYSTNSTYHELLSYIKVDKVRHIKSILDSFPINIEETLYEPINLAIKRNSINACKFLIDKYKPKTDKINTLGLIACSCGYLDILLLLLEYDKKIDFSFSSYSMLIAAYSNDHFDVAHYLFTNKSVREYLKSEEQIYPEMYDTLNIHYLKNKMKGFV